MRGRGTDALALTCILAGAAVSGVVTVAARGRGDLERRLAEDLRRMGEELTRLEGDVGR